MADKCPSCGSSQSRPDSDQCSQCGQLLGYQLGLFNESLEADLSEALPVDAHTDAKESNIELEDGAQLRQTIIDELDDLSFFKE